MKVLVCDDIEDQKLETEKAVKDGCPRDKDGCPRDAEVIVLPQDQIEERLRDLFSFATDYLKALEDNSERPTRPTGFDDFGIILLDNNLAHLNVGGVRITAETIAGYIRTFSNSPYIVSLNKNPEIDFDLRYLIGDYSTVADLAINTDHLKNRALWSGKPEDASNGFLPSYWPKLLSEPNRREKQIQFISEKLDEPIFEALGIPSQVARFISRHATGSISPDVDFAIVEKDNDDSESVSILNVTFREFFENRNRSIQAKEDRDLLLTDCDSESSSAAQSRDYVARAVAADIDLWIRRDLLAPQDALVDLPHLLARMPFLLGDKSSDISNWNSAIREESASFGLDENLFDNHVRPWTMTHVFWAPSPTFYWPMLKVSDELNRLFLDFSVKWADAIYCEDRSLFQSRNVGGTPSPAEFKAEFEGAWSRRYVAQVKDRRYAPRSRFAY